MPLIAALIIIALLLAFLVISALAVSHARKFRFISKRTKVLTTFYIGSTAVICLLIIVSAILVDWSIG